MCHIGWIYTYINTDRPEHIFFCQLKSNTLEQGMFTMSHNSCFWPAARLHYLDIVYQCCYARARLPIFNYDMIRHTERRESSQTKHSPKFAVPTGHWANGAYAQCLFIRMLTEIYGAYVACIYITCRAVSPAWQ